MKIWFIGGNDRKASRWGVEAAGVVLMLAVAGALWADDNTKKKDEKSHPAHSAQPAASGHAAPAQHTAPPQQTAAPQQHTAPAQHTAPPQQTAAPQQHTAPPQHTAMPPRTPSGNEPTNTFPAGRQERATHPMPSDRQPGRPAAVEPANRTPNAPGMRFGGRPDEQRVNQPGNRPMSSPAGREPANVTRHPNGRIDTYRGANNTEVRFRNDGRPAVVRTRDATIVHNSAGGRTVVVNRPDRTVIVTHGGGAGYVQRPFVVRNQTFVQRTYVVNQRTYVNVYRPVVYRGMTVNVYTPMRHYSPAFYNWAYSPWQRPVYYSWGWSRAPWYAYYGPYFTPYPVYRSPAFWLTDFFLAATLEVAYQERAAANMQAAYSPGGQTPLTPEVKQAIADEVQRQVQADRADAQNANGGAPSLFDDGTHVFVVNRGLDVRNLAAGGQECMISEGDVLQANAPPPQNSEFMNVLVLASKGADCPVRSVVSISIQDLVEMQNNMRETVGRGMEELRNKQGQSGLPALPPGAGMAPVDASFASAVPPPDQNVTTELAQQNQQAVQEEQAVVSQAQAPGDAAGGGPPATIALGQTADQVIAILGQPAKVADLGAKRILYYKDMKVTLVDGRVSDVQ